MNRVASWLTGGILIPAWFVVVIVLVLFINGAILVLR